MKNISAFFDKFVESKKQEMLTLWQNLVDIDSGPGCEKGFSEIAGVLEHRLARFCSSVRRRKFDGAPDSIIAIRNGAGQKDGRVALLGHMDTVFGKGAPMRRPFSVDGDIVRGSGVLDMKGGLVQILFVLEALDAAGWSDREIVIVISGDEEVGHVNSSEGSKKLFAEAAEGAVALFCSESGREDDSLVVARKGVGEIVVTTRGKSAHAGNDFWSGANAILEIAGKAREIAAMSDGESTTLNIGKIRGGSANNIVPDFAEISVDVRITDDDDWPIILGRVGEIVSNVEIPGTLSVMRSRLEIPPMKQTEESMKLLDYVSGINEKITGRPLKGVMAGGGADSSFFASHGVPCLCAMGPAGAHNHTSEEYARLSSLLERTKLLAEVISGL